MDEHVEIWNAVEVRSAFRTSHVGEIVVLKNNTKFQTIMYYVLRLCHRGPLFSVFVEIISQLSHWCLRPTIKTVTTTKYHANAE